jgi:hypothetical protein
MISSNRTLPFLLLGAAFLAACGSGRSGRIMSDSDQDYVDIDGAAGAEFDRLIEGSVQRLLRLPIAADRNLEKAKVVTLAVQNDSGQELGDWQESIYQLIDTSINRSERFENISRRFVAEALKENGLRQEQLFIPRHQRAFLSTLEQRNLPIDFLLFPTLTRGTTHAGQGITQRSYELSLELVDVKSGKSDKVIERLRKEFRQ